MRRWIVWTTVGEATGFAIAAVVAVGVAASPGLGGFGYPIVVAAGAIEGAALGLGQHRGMSSDRPGRGRWVGVTALGAAIAWAIGLLPSTLGFIPADAGGYLLVVLGGVVLLLSIPIAQWTAMRSPSAVRWIPICALAWIAGAAWTIAPSPFIDERSPLGLIVGLYVVAGVLMALTVAAVTAPLALRLWPAAGQDRDNHRLVPVHHARDASALLAES